MDPTLQSAAPPAGDQPMPPTEAPQEEQPNVTPEEQSEYDAVMTAALGFLYDEKAFAGHLEKLKTSGDLAHNIGHSAAMLMQSLDGRAKKDGKQINQDVLFSVGSEVVHELCQIAVAGGLMESSEIPQMVEAAMFQGMQVYGESMIEQGEVTPEKQEQAKAELAANKIPQKAPAGEAAPTAPPAEAPPPGIVNSGVK